MNHAGFGLKRGALTLPVRPVRREWPFWEKLAGTEGVAGAEDLQARKASPVRK